MSSVMAFDSDCYISSNLTMKAQLQWKIKHSALKKKTPGQCFQSPNFHAFGDEPRKWIVKFYPHLGLSGCQSTFLIHPASPPKSDCQAIITATLLDAKLDETIWSGAKDDHFPAWTTRGKGFVGVYDGLWKICYTGSDLIVRCEVKYKVEKMAPPHGHHSDLAADLSRFLTSNNIDDVTFVIGEMEFPANKLILIARSPVFAKMFQQHPNEASQDRIIVDDIDPDIFQALLHFMYTDQVYLNSDNSASILAAAGRFSLELLVAKCENFLVENLTRKNCCEILLLAHHHKSNHLKTSAVKYIRENVSHVMETQEWKQLEESCPQLVIETLKTLLFFEKNCTTANRPPEYVRSPEYFP